MFLLNIENISPFTFKDLITSTYIHLSSCFPLHVAITLLLTCNKLNEMPECTWAISQPKHSLSYDIIGVMGRPLTLQLHWPRSTGHPVWRVRTPKPLG